MANENFDEILLDPNLFTVGDAQGSPEFANGNIRNPLTGVMNVAIGRYDAQHVWNFDLKMMTPAEGSFTSEVDYFNNMWYGGFGSGYGFRIRIETDHLAVGEVLGTSNGTLASRTWKLTRTYNRPGTTTHPYIRYICKPVVNINNTSGKTLYEPDGITSRVIESPFKVFLNGVDMGGSGWTIDNTTGILSLAATPTTGVVVSWSGQFDVPARFFLNSHNQKNEFPAQITGLVMIEMLPAELGL